MQDEMVSKYINDFDGDTKKRLLEIQKLGHELLPDAKEKISYGIPTFYNENGFIVYFAGYKDFVSIYPVHFASKLLPELKPYLSGKSTARFKNQDPLPTDLIKNLIMALNTNNLERSGR